MKFTARSAWILVRETARAWLADNAASMGAAIAFYTMFSAAPLLLIVIALAGYFFGAEAARGEIVEQLSNLIGRSGAHGVEGLVARASASPLRNYAAGLGVVFFLVGSVSMFNELQNALNRIWKAHRSPRTSGILAVVRSWLVSFGMILSTAVILIADLSASTVLAAIRKLGGSDWAFTLQMIETVSCFALLTAVFALIFKVVPNVRVRWEDVWIGAAITATLFEVGKLLIGVYLGRTGTLSAFGRIRSVALFLLWVYYSAQVFLLGAKFTYVYSKYRHRRLARHSPGPPGAHGRHSGSAAKAPAKTR